MTRIRSGIGGLMLAASLGFSLIHPWGDLRHVDSRGKILTGSTIPPDVLATIQIKCADCHSNRTDWPVYSRLAPGSWLIERDVFAARAAMNLSQWNQMPGQERIAALTRIAAEVRSGQMPPRTYGFMHPANRLTNSEKQEIAAWARGERKRLQVASQPKEVNR